MAVIDCTHLNCSSLIESYVISNLFLLTGRDKLLYFLVLQYLAKSGYINTHGLFIHSSFHDSALILLLSALLLGGCFG